MIKRICEKSTSFPSVECQIVIESTFFVTALATLVDCMENQRPMQATTKSSGSLPTYRAYLMRCWQERNSALDGEPIWRFSLDASWYEERRGFASLQALMEHLQTELMNQDTSPAEE